MGALALGFLPPVETYTYSKSVEVNAEVVYSFTHKPSDVRGLIVWYAEFFETDPALPIAVARAESNFKNVPNYLYDGEDGYYTAYGIFQITRTTFKAFCGNPDLRKDIEENIKCGVKIIANGGIGHWNASSAVWEANLESEF